MSPESILIRSKIGGASHLLELAGLVVAFALIITMVNKKYPLASAMFSAAGILAITSEKQLSYLFGEALKAAGAQDTLELAAVVTLIGIMSRVMDRYGLLRQMSDGLARSMKSVKPAISIIPALVGAMPVLGGAVMSAPMIDRLGDLLEMTPRRKAAANLVFRHGVFFFFPFSPSLILAAKLSNIDIGALIKILFPFAIVLWAVGYFLYLRGVPEQAGSYDPLHRWTNLKRFFWGMSPIFLSIVLGMGFKAPLYYALLIGIALALWLGKDHVDFDLSIIWKSIDWKMAIAMVGIMVFRSMVQNIGFIGRFLGILQGAGIPMGVVFFVLPCLIGITSASQSTTIAITFPMLLPFVPAGESKAAYVMLIHVSSFLAYFASPMHMCALLTNEYFKVKVSECFNEVKPVILSLAVACILWFFVLR